LNVGRLFDATPAVPTLPILEENIASADVELTGDEPQQIEAAGAQITPKEPATRRGHSR
jgi:hypothetical protein